MSDGAEPATSGDPSPAQPVRAAEVDGPVSTAEERVMLTALGVTLSLALLGYVTGMWQANRAPIPAPEKAAPPAPTDVQTALSYGELSGGALSRNKGFRTDLKDLPAPAVDPFGATQPSEAERRAALERRATRRAYAGAPPTIPHRVTSRRADDCLACHERGVKVADRIAPPLPHASYVNCLQCHAGPPPVATADAPVGTGKNTFEGLAEAAGTRVGPGGPPVIPHSTWMRTECLACHGPKAADPGLRTSHPWRVSCRQCHAASAGYAQ